MVICGSGGNLKRVLSGAYYLGAAKNSAWLRSVLSARKKGRNGCINLIRCEFNWLRQEGLQLKGQVDLYMPLRLWVLVLF